MISLATTSPARTRRALRACAVACAAALAVALAPPRPAFAGERAAPAHSPAGALTPGELERIHGVRLLRVAVTAAGGLVDLRLQVLDARKAAALLHGPGGAPRLLPEGSARELFAPQHMAHSLSTRLGSVSYLLFPNVAGSIRPGTRLAVAFGEVRVAPLVAR